MDVFFEMFLYHGQTENNNEENKRDSGSIAKILKVKTFFEDIINDNFSGTVGAADWRTGHKVNLREYLEGGNSSHHYNIIGSWRDKRHGQFEELSYFAGAVNFSGFVIGRRDILKTGEIDNHVIADASPDSNNTDSKESQRGSSHPVWKGNADSVKHKRENTFGFSQPF